MSDQAINPRLFERPPCYRCGYNGPGYYQPDMHACAKDYHERVRSQARTREELLAMVAQLRGELATAREVIQALMDAQDAIPLLKYERDYHGVNMRAEAFLEKTKGGEL